MSEKTMVENVKAFAASKALSYLDGDPDKNIPKLLEWVDKFDKKDEWLTQRNAFRAVIENPDNNWYKLIKSLWTDIDDGVRKVFFENFIINSNLIGAPREEKMRKEHGCNIPWAILMDPTSACNLKCKGCWAAEYGNKLNMSYEQLDDIINQGVEMGTYMYLFTGGEPLVRKDDIIKLCAAHPDCQLFMAYKEGQPFNNNHLRPCPMLENPEALKAMVEKSGAHSTDMQSPEDVADLYKKCKPYADNWENKANELWDKSHPCAGCSGCQNK